MFGHHLPNAIEGIVGHLASHDAKRMPDWLARYVPGERVPLSTLLGGRVCFCPGAGSDVEAFEIFGRSGASHVSLFADYLFDPNGDGTDPYKPSPSSVLDAIGNSSLPGAGYSELSRWHISEAEVCEFLPQPWVPGMIRCGVIAETSPEGAQLMQWASGAKAYDMRRKTQDGWVVVLERNTDSVFAYGARRIVLVYLCADAFETFDALLARNANGAHGIFLQVNGAFSCSHTPWGNDDRMFQLASAVKKLPKWMVFGSLPYGNGAWVGYSQVPGVPTYQLDRGRTRTLMRLESLAT